MADGLSAPPLEAGQAEVTPQAAHQGDRQQEQQQEQLLPPAGTSGGGERRKPGRPAVHSGCQVCGASLHGMRMFHQRYHICEDHMQAEQLLWKGVPQRFCQQCGRFHELHEFDAGMRSCRKQLAKHAERRRRGRERASAERAQQQLQLLRQQQAQQGQGQAAGLVAPPGSTGGSAAGAAGPAAFAGSDAERLEVEDAAAVAPAPVSRPTAILLSITEDRAEQHQQHQQQSPGPPALLPSTWRLTDSSASTAMHQSAMSLSQSAGGIGALLSAAAAEEAAPAGGGQNAAQQQQQQQQYPQGKAALAGAEGQEEQQETGQGQGQASDSQQLQPPRKQQRIALEPDPQWFAAAPTQATKSLPRTSPSIALLPGAGSPLPLHSAPISALNSSSMERRGAAAVEGNAAPTAAAAAVPAEQPATLAAALLELQRQQQLQLQQLEQRQQQQMQHLQLQQQLQQLTALQQAMASQAFQPQQAAVLSALQAVLEQQQQQQGGAPNPSAPSPALQHQQQLLLHNVQVLAAQGASPALPQLTASAPLGLSEQQQAGLLRAQQREQHVAALFHAAVETLVRSALGPVLPQLPPPQP